MLRHSSHITEYLHASHTVVGAGVTSRGREGIDLPHRIFPRPSWSLTTTHSSPHFVGQVAVTTCPSLLTHPQSPLSPLQAASGPTSPWKLLPLRTPEISSLSNAMMGSIPLMTQPPSNVHTVDASSPLCDILSSRLVCHYLLPYGFPSNFLA